MGKEIERQIGSSEEIAIQEVENYIEKVEKSTETSLQDNQGNQSKPQFSDKDVNQVGGLKQAMGITAGTVKKIVLPLSAGGIANGLQGSVFAGIRWLAEWCVMMIKKYPGRVFYSSPTGQGYD